MNLFYFQAAMVDRKLIDASFDGNSLFLMTAYPGYPIKEMLQIASSAVDVILLAEAGNGNLERLLDPLNPSRTVFARRSVIEEMLLWANAYLRRETPLASAYAHWEGHYRGAAGRCDVERYRAVNELIFEYAYRTINQFPGGFNVRLSADGPIRSFIENESTLLDPGQIYQRLNLECGFKANPKDWVRDILFSSIYKTVVPQK